MDLLLLAFVLLVAGVLVIALTLADTLGAVFVIVGLAILGVVVLSRARGTSRL